MNLCNLWINILQTEKNVTRNALKYALSGSADFCSFLSLVRIDFEESKSQ